MKSTQRTCRFRFSRVAAGLIAGSLAQGLASAAFAQRPDPEEIVAAHNKWRAEVGVPPLSWSAQVAASAASWSRQLQRDGCRVAHSPREQRRGMGENLFWASARMSSDGDSIQAISSAAVVDEWGSEKAFYHVRSNSCRGGQCGHYTQIVWSGTREVGCAAAVCQDKSQVWVCQYSPSGNFIGERPFQINQGLIRQLPQ